MDNSLTKHRLEERPGSKMTLKLHHGQLIKWNKILLCSTIYYLFYNKKKFYDENDASKGKFQVPHYVKFM